MHRSASAAAAVGFGVSAFIAAISLVAVVSAATPRAPARDDQEASRSRSARFRLSELGLRQGLGGEWLCSVVVLVGSVDARAYLGPRPGGR